MKLLVYVGAKFENKLQARLVMDSVQALGHEITHDWTNTEACAKDSSVIGAADMRGVLTAHVFFMIPHPNGYGLMTELGLALASGKRIIIAGPVERGTPFLSLARCERFASVTEALNALGPA